MNPDPELHRGWTASMIREGIRLATPRQRSVLRQIAISAPVTAKEVGDALGVSMNSVAVTLAGWTTKITPLGVYDHGTTHVSWPFSPNRRPDGSSDYLMSDAVREVIIAETGDA